MGWIGGKINGYKNCLKIVLEFILNLSLILTITLKGDAWHGMIVREDYLSFFIYYRLD